MAITVASLLSASTTTAAANTYTTASMSPTTTGNPVILLVGCSTSGTTPVSVASITGMGLTWTVGVQGNKTDDGTNSWRPEIWKGVGTASTGTCAIVFSGATTGQAVNFLQFAGCHLTAPIRQTVAPAANTTNATSGAGTLPASVLAGDAVVGVFVHAANESSTQGTDFTGTSTTSYGSPSTGFLGEYNLTPTDAVIDGSWATSSDWQMVGAEIDLPSHASGSIESAGVILT